MRLRAGMGFSRDPLVAAIIGCAIEVHRVLGPGLLESPYRRCLAREFTLKRLPFETEVALPVVYKGERLNCGFRLDFVVEGRVVVEVKSVARLMPIHSAQLLTYMKLLSAPRGVLLNFNVPLMKYGIRCLELRADASS